MIIGKKIDNSRLPTTLAKLFFILNLFIEASYNQTSKSHLFYNKINSLSNKLNTNYFIYHIYKIIKNDPSSIDPNLLITNNNKMYDIPNINESGNPLSYYEELLKYLNYNSLKFMKHKFVAKNLVSDLIQKNFNDIHVNNIPDIIIFEDFQSGTLFETNYNFFTINKTNKTNNTNNTHNTHNKNTNDTNNTHNKKYNYVLDSIILTNKDHFDAKANSHFVSLLTINKKNYKYDGSSISKLEPFNWIKLINKNKDWYFKENPLYENELYNCTKGYKIMFYYRS
jgi:hypothetical protein